MAKVRWGIVGAGDIVRKRVLPALKQLSNSECLGVVRGNAITASEFAAANGIERSYPSALEMLADPEIDAVYIASPVYLHADHSIAAAEAGKHVLCEKPMALTANECRRMIDAARENGVKLGIAYNRRFYPVMGRIREALTSGEIGVPVFAQANTFERFDPVPGDPRRWFLEPEKSGGGPMMDFGCHRLEVLTHLFGEVETLKSINSNSVLGREVEDTSMALMQFTSGMTAVLTVTHAAIESVDTLEIFGTSGTIRVGSLNKGDITFSFDGSLREEAHPPASNFHVPLIDDFVRAVLDDREPTVSGEAGYRVALLEDQIYGR